MLYCRDSIRSNSVRTRAACLLPFAKGALSPEHLSPAHCGVLTLYRQHDIRHSRQWITFQWIQNDSARFSSDRRTQIAGCGIQAVAIDSASATHTAMRSPISLYYPLQPSRMYLQHHIDFSSDHNSLV